MSVDIATAGASRKNSSMNLSSCLLSWAVAGMYGRRNIEVPRGVPHSGQLGPAAGFPQLGQNI